MAGDRMAKIPMSLLRILVSLRDAPLQCQWALLGGEREPIVGTGPLAQLPQRAERVQLVLPAAEVLITQARLPQAARRRSGSVLAFAVEEQTLGEPDTHQVSWLGSSAGADVLAVVDRPGLTAWRDALEAAGIHGYEVHCETLMLPWTAGEWTLAWNGREGFVRTGEYEGTTTDCGAADSPPLSLRMMLEVAKTRGEAPGSIAVVVTAPDALPEIEPWQRALGVALRPAGPWHWRTAPPEAGVSLAQERARWRLAPGTLAKLRPAAWIAGAALAIHSFALVADWTRLAIEQRSLRQQMESRFRAAFPDAVAVADPALQMRRKLAEARHAAGQPDDSDFQPMVVKVAAALKGVPASALRVLSYESGRVTLELAALDEANVRRIVARLLEAGLRAESAGASARAGGATVLLTVRLS
ncbi:MAG: general secretion pathway protein GspL [Betaproteobacteria bacterium RIFCSPLOWO2_02_67_12]|nr:MAG: general secretion pathway protein GspL [Betaproteobacteria bacterium RIFCSPLOWO2_02_67_12]OGA28827.1 MAG: general secretion pathway protein GspL [Betaproteobacteria bacterium RIFCSPLOWO2_02_FULL_68_150]OGA63135.1 MAG: general secretion pathway protein GspL [Betaproteobacteria bacterium RIFCSPLOWO2_12_FULL_67_28]